MTIYFKAKLKTYFSSNLLVSTVLQLEGSGWDKRGRWGGIFLLESCKDQFIRVGENMVQHPSNYISIKFCLILESNTEVNIQFYIYPVTEYRVEPVNGTVQVHRNGSYSELATLFYGTGEQVE